MTSHRARRLVTGLALTLALTPGLTLATGAPVAAAATACTGRHIDSESIRDTAGKVYGTLDLYYDSSTRRNCAKAINGTGHRHTMIVQITPCRRGTGATTYSCLATELFVQGKNMDEGNYISYAGPVNTIGPSAGLCIEASAAIYVGLPIEPYAIIPGHCS